MESAEQITQKLKVHYRSLPFTQYSNGEQSLPMKFKLLLKNKGQHFVAKKDHHGPAVTLRDILKPSGSKEKRRILLEGGAGIGKTTFCIDLCKDWANGNLFQEEYDVLLFFPLSQPQWWSAHSLRKLISEMLNHGVSQVLDNLVRYTENRNGKGVLVIADGWNELDRPKHPKKESYFYKLLFGKVLSSASVLVTSRPTASAILHRDDVVDRYVEICGFNEESLEIFIRSQFASNQLKADALFHHPLLRHICSFAVTCKYLCLLWHTCDTCTMTELCTKIIVNIIKFCYHCQKMDAPVNISSLPQIDGVQNNLNFKELCKIAFQSFGQDHENKQLHIKSYVDGIMMFGLVEYDDSEGVSDKVFVSFPHPTSQEYLAALHIVNQPLDNQLQVLRTINSKQENTSLFWSLYLGLFISNYQRFHSDSVFCQALQMASAFDLPKCHLCHYANKAQSDAITSQVIKCLSTQVKENTIVQLSGAHNSHDCDAMLYVIDNIKDSKCDGLHIDFSECGFSGEQIHRLATILVSNAKLQVKKLDLSGNSLPDEQVTHLFKNAAASFKSIETLFVRNNKICEKGITAIMEALPKSRSQSLKQLDISFNPLIMPNVFKCLRDAIKSYRLANLKTLFMQGCLGSNAEKNTRNLKTFSKEIWRYCKYLQELDLYGNDFVTSDVTDIIMQLGDNNIRLMLDGETVVEIMQDSIKKERMIKHTVVHGVFVGPGRSGKNSLMNRLMGEGPSDPNEVIPSTGVLENVVKVEVKKLCGVATSDKKCLQWRRVKYKHEDIELIMATITNQRAGTKESDCVDTVPKNVETLHKEPLVVASANVASEYQTHFKNTSTAESPDPVKTTEADSEDLRLDKACVMCKGQNDSEANSNSHMHSDDPLDMIRHAIELRRMDALCEHFESSWMLYLTNTGGQTEFQELLPVLVCGPSVFFITFPLNQNLNDCYMVCYDGCHESESYNYESSATLVEEILQTLTTIDFLDRSRTYNKGALKVLFIGTHKDKLKPKLLECSVDDHVKVFDKRLRECEIDDQTKSISVDDQNLLKAINEQLRECGVDDQTVKIISVDDQVLIKTYDEQLQKCEVNDQTEIFRDGGEKKVIIIISVNDQIKTIEKQLRNKVERTMESLGSKHSIVYAVNTNLKQLIFTVNNFDEEDTDFYDIQLRLQEEVEKCKSFTAECRFSSLIFSLILRAKHTSEKLMGYSRCFNLAKRCGITNISDLHEALSFIHRNLGLVLYFHDFHMKGFDRCVIIDPHFLFEFITYIINKKIVEVHGDSDEKEDFNKRGVISKKLIENVCTRPGDEEISEKFGMWVIHLLVHLKLVAVFVKEGNEFYFFPSVLCRAQLPPPCPTISQVNEPPPLLIGFKGGFCPRGLPGALITHLMTNCDVNKWEFRSKQVYRNQVSFEVIHGVITLKIFCTHLEVKLGDNLEMSNFTTKDEEDTCKDAICTLEKAMNIVTEAYYRHPESENNSFFFGFYCTHSNCKAPPHFTKIVYLKDKTMKLRCTNVDEHTDLPPNYDRWMSQHQLLQLNHQGI